MNNDRDMLNQGGRNMPVTPGTDVYDATGDKIGKVEEYNPQANCIVVKKGVIFTKDLYVPLSAIDSRDSDGLYLNLTKDQLKDDRYASPPASYTTTTTTSSTDNDILDRGARRDAMTDRTTRDEVSGGNQDWNPDLNRDLDTNQ